MTIAELHTLSGAYAVHALQGPERAAFERHLEQCASCAREVAELEATAERLGVATARRPAPEMKAQVLRRIAVVRQEPPHVSARTGRDEESPGRVRSASRSVGRFALAACLAAAAAFGGIAVWQHQEARDARAQARQVERRTAQLSRVLASPDAVSSSGKLVDGATGTVVVSRSLNQAAFFAEGMPELRGGKVYQLWFDDHGTMRSAGLMPASAAAGSPGTSTRAVLLDGTVDKATGMGITVEPAGGSKKPTSAPLALMAFPQSA